MATTPKDPTAGADAPTGGTTPEVPLSSPTVTHYQQLADQFMKDLDAIASVIPKLEASHISTATFVRTHTNVSINFLATCIAAVEQTAALQGVNKLNSQAARDTLQFIEAFRPVLDKVESFTNSLRFTVASRKAALTADALQIYFIAKGVARDPGSAAVASLVANMKRDLGRPGVTKAARIKKAEEKARLAQVAAQVPPAKPTGVAS
jgi:hypothetical protein